MTQLLFIRSGGIADWDLHLHYKKKDSCSSWNIYKVHAGEHTAYAESARIYLDQNKGIQRKMRPAKYGRVLDHQNNVFFYGWAIYLTINQANTHEDVQIPQRCSIW